MALQLDLVALFGQLATGNEPQAGNLASPNPQGLLSALSRTTPVATSWEVPPMARPLRLPRLTTS